MAALAASHRAADAQHKKEAVRARAEVEDAERALHQRQRQERHQALVRRAEAEKRAAEVRARAGGGCCRRLPLATAVPACRLLAPANASWYATCLPISPHRPRCQAARRAEEQRREAARREALARAEREGEERERWYAARQQAKEAELEQRRAEMAELRALRQQQAQMRATYARCVGRGCSQPGHNLAAGRGRLAGPRLAC